MHAWWYFWFISKVLSAEPSSTPTSPSPLLPPFQLPCLPLPSPPLPAPLHPAAPLVTGTLWREVRLSTCWEASTFPRVSHLLFHTYSFSKQDLWTKCFQPSALILKIFSLASSLCSFNEHFPHLIKKTTYFFYKK